MARACELKRPDFRGFPTGWLTIATAGNITAALVMADLVDHAAHMRNA
jgi:hypothetical protein